VHDVSGAGGYALLMPLHEKRLSTYLNDHLAALTGGVELAKRTLGSNEGTPYGELLASLRDELEDDKAALLETMQQLDVGKNPVKEGLGWAAEKLGRLKLNDQITGYSPLSRLVEFEGLSLILATDAALWTTLGEVAGVETGDRAARVERRRAELERLRVQAAREALLS
jgi:hypothetical protein